MFKRILVPLDGSPLAERVIPHAELFARIFRSNIVLLQVLDPASFHENPNAVDPLSWQIRKAEADMYMQGIANRIRKNLKEMVPGDLEEEDRVEYCIREGKTAENIVDFANSENIDLLIISSHGSGGLSRWNISSITQKVINMIYLPVLIIRAYTQTNPDENLRRYRRILIPIDSSRRAECSLSAGIELVRSEIKPANLADSSKLVLVSVIRPPELPFPEPFPIEISQLSNQFLEISRMGITKYLDEMKERIPVDCDTCVVENSSVTTAIQELADQEDIDLVILCAHGHSGQMKWPYGTVTHNYIEHGIKPVLIIQDIARPHVRPTAAEVAAEKSGRR
jgi:nucleotide-binding universal stress UspA family protein